VPRCSGAVISGGAAIISAWKLEIIYLRAWKLEIISFEINGRLQVSQEISIPNNRALWTYGHERRRSSLVIVFACSVFIPDNTENITKPPFLRGTMKY
jgi:hypothetical protein